ncbi:hypothetical protein ES705_16074 [subsurface metagenome]
MDTPTLDKIYNNLKLSYKYIDFRAALYRKEKKWRYIISVFRFINKSRNELTKRHNEIKKYKEGIFKIESEILEINDFEKKWEEIKNNNNNLESSKPTGFFYSNINPYLTEKIKFRHFHFNLFINDFELIRSDLRNLEGVAKSFFSNNIFDLIKKDLEIDYGEGYTCYSFINFPILIEINELKYIRRKLSGQIKFHKIYNNSEVKIKNYKEGHYNDMNIFQEQDFHLSIEKAVEFGNNFYLQDFKYDFLKSGSTPFFKILIYNDSIIENEFLLDCKSSESDIKNRLLLTMKRFNRKYKIGQENNFRNDLSTFLEGAGFDAKQNYSVEGGGHVDILINHHISMQLKIVPGKPEFDFVTGQASNDIGRFEFSMAVIFDTTKDRKYYKKYHNKKKKEGIFYYVYF